MSTVALHDARIGTVLDKAAADAGQTPDDYLAWALSEAGTVTLTAYALGVSGQSVRRWMRLYGISTTRVALPRKENPHTQEDLALPVDAAGVADRYHESAWGVGS